MFRSLLGPLLCKTSWSPTTLSFLGRKMQSFDSPMIGPYYTGIYPPSFRKKQTKKKKAKGRNCHCDYRNSLARWFSCLHNHSYCTYELKSHFYTCSLYSAVSYIPSMCLYLEWHVGFTKHRFVCVWGKIARWIILWWRFALDCLTQEGGRGAGKKKRTHSYLKC